MAPALTGFFVVTTKHAVTREADFPGPAPSAPHMGHHAYLLVCHGKGPSLSHRIVHHLLCQLARGEGTVQMEAGPVGIWEAGRYVGWSLWGKQSAEQKDV